MTRRVPSQPLTHQQMAARLYHLRLEQDLDARNAHHTYASVGIDDGLVSDLRRGKLVEATAEEPVILHLALAEVYGAKIKALAGSLGNEATKAEAIELLRSLVTEVRLHPDESAEDGHVIELYGELAAILERTKPKNDKTHRFTGGLSVTLVAGVGFEPTTFRL